MSFWLASFHCVVIINSRGHIHILSTGPYMYICDCYCYFLAQLSFVNCVAREGETGGENVATGNGILQSHAHVSAGCLCSFSLIKPGSRSSSSGTARMPLTGLVFHKQIEWQRLTVAANTAIHYIIHTYINPRRATTTHTGSCLFHLPALYLNFMLFAFSQDIAQAYTNIWRL